MATLNPNWPLVSINADFTQGPPHIPGASAVSLNAPSRRNAVRAIDIQRGRQYELDQVQAGTASVTIVDPLEQLHPSNGSSPFNTGGNTITSYRCCQIGAWWNPSATPVGGNFLNAGNAAPGQPTIFTTATYGYDPSFESWYVTQTVSAGSTYGVSVAQPDGAYTVWQASLASSAAAVTFFPRCSPGGVYTLSFDVYAAANVTVTATYGATTVSSTTTGAYQNRTLGPFPAVLNSSISFKATTTGSYPAVFYLANMRLTGVMPGWSQSGGSAMGYTLAQAHSGSYALGSTMAANTDTFLLPVPLVPGVTYTMSSWVYAVGAGTVAAMTVAGTTVSTSVVNTWQRLVVTFVATDAVANVRWTIPTASGGYPAALYVDDLMLQAAAAASAYTSTGPTFFPLYTGYIERYPIQWDMTGTRGIRPLTCVDALSILSRTEISQSYAATIAADSPYAVVPYNDLALPHTVQLPQGGAPFLGYQNLGTQGTVNFQGDTTLDGSPAVTVTQQNANPPISANNTYITYLGTLNGSVPMNPQTFTIEVWAKQVAGAMYFGAGSVPVTEAINTEPFGPAAFVGWYTSGGRLCWYYDDPTAVSTYGGVVASGPYAGFPDGQWHYLAIRLPGSNGLNAITDNVVGGTATITPAVSVALNNFFIDCQTYTGDPVCTVSLANLACYPTPLSNARLLAHYNRGAGYINEVSGARVSRLLAVYWPGGATSVAAGKRQMAPDFNYNGRFMLDVLQEIQETERGLVYANTAGTLVFEDSVSRYSAQAALWVFGENPTGASPVEYPYSELVQAFDPTYTFSQTNLTRPGNASFAPLPNPLPTNPPYGQRVLSQQVQVNTDFDLTQASVFYLHRYGNPTVRVETLTLNPAANPALWPVVLSLEISQRITVKRRTAAGLTTSADYYIEQISHSIDATAGTWKVGLQCSPVFNPVAWILGDAVYGVLGTTTIPVY